MVSARRGRPTRSRDDIATMRQRVADVAARLFREEGYASVSMRRMAREVGCTPMTLYAYFDSKTDILSHLWERVYDSLFGELASLAGPISDPLDRLAAVARRYVGYWVDNPETYRMVFMTEGVSQPEVSAFLDASATVDRFQLFFDTMRDVLGAPGEAELKMRTEILLSGLLGIAHNHVTISGYPWSPAEAMAGDLVSALARL